MKRHIQVPVITTLAAALLAGCGVVFATPVLAQQQGVPPAAESSSNGLDERILRLEQRIQDLQSVIGTLESFIRDGGAAPAQGVPPPAGGQGASPAAGGPSEVSMRVLALETQISALTGQMGQITQRLNQMQTPPGAGAPPLAPGQQSLPPPAQQPGSQSGASFSSLQRRATGAAAPPARAPQFGTSASVSQQLAALASGGEGPRAMYDTSYQNFLRNDFAAAENGFRSFIATYSNDPLIGNAHYWLGRTHFARRQFKPAAEAFLAGYKKDKKSSIAPDALLHLGLSLTQLGETEAACSTFGEVSKQFPDASDNVKREAAEAIQRVRC